MATEGTKFQVNYKLNDGTLINLYAADVRELEAGLADIAMNALNIISTGKELSQGAPKPNFVEPAVISPAVSAIAAQFKDLPAAPAAGGNSCKHGAMTYKTGVSAKGPWQGWMCPTPKGAPDKCDTIWIR